MNELFGRSFRVLTKKDYGRVFAKPRRTASRAFTVLACRGATNHARLGLAVSKKVDKRAVKRNQIKRLARESFRRNAIRQQPVDLVVIARAPAASMSARELLSALESHWNQLMSWSRSQTQSS
ncbi:MAG: ribonuclease P protein component [Pseudomonadota bacterium]